MTEQGLRIKIASILQSRAFENAPFKDVELGYITALDIADALIAAGIDVSCLREHRVIAEYSLVPDDDNPYIIPNVPLRVTQLYSGEEVEKMAKECKELKDELRSKVEYIHEQDEVIKEYKHRAARAERALGNACEDVKGLVSFLIELSERVDGLRVEGYLPEESEPKAYINRAEKELAEERKDG